MLPKEANTLTYVATPILLAIDRENQRGLSGEVERQYLQTGQIPMTMEQAKLLLQQTDINAQIRVLNRIVVDNRTPQEPVIDVEVKHLKDFEPENPTEKRVAGLITAANRGDKTEQRAVEDIVRQNPNDRTNDDLF